MSKEIENPCFQCWFGEHDRCGKCQFKNLHWSRQFDSCVVICNNSCDCCDETSVVCEKGKDFSNRVDADGLIRTS